MAQLALNYFSQALSRTVDVQAIIPLERGLSPETKNKKQPFKTLYLLHGMFGDQNDWLTGTRVKRWATEKNIAVIMPSGENKFYVDNALTGENFGQFISKELVDFTRALFPLSKKREDTFIAGLSMGGYGAIVNGLQNARTFGAVIGLSSALNLERIVQSTDDEPLSVRKRSYYQSIFGDLDKLKTSPANPEFLIHELKRKKLDIPKLYLACGKEDFLLSHNRAFHQFLKKEKVPHVYEEAPGGHDWDYWDTYIKKVLEWLAPGEA